LSEQESALAEVRPYFRRDQSDGISPPDISKECSYSDHIVHARGKRTRFTSVTLDLARCRDFGECSYRLHREIVEADMHKVVEHEALLAELQQSISQGEKDERLKALQAFRYAKTRKEGLVDWHFDISRIERKEIIGWTQRQIQKYFVRL
jgi:hypothetical protein